MKKVISLLTLISILTSCTSHMKVGYEFEAEAQCERTGE